MKADYTHICFVIDASGSMSCIANDVRGSFDSFMDTQRELPGEVFVDVYQFSGKVSHLVNSVALENFDNDLMKKYTCQGCTALNDAVCTAIDELGVKLANMAESDRPSLVNFIIITDGEENASREFSSDDVKRRIKVQQEQYRWEFRFLAANQDAFAAGGRIGVQSANCVNFDHSSAGIQNCILAEARNLCFLRTNLRKELENLENDGKIS